MITVTYDAETFTLSVHGHANYAERGKDIVCSAVSTLVQTLMACLEDIADTREFTRYADGIIVKADGNDEKEHDIKLLFYSCMTGIEHIAAQYPDYVCLNQ